MGAFVFVVSLMPVPVPGLGTVSHPCGTSLAAILLGPFTAVALGAVAQKAGVHQSQLLPWNLTGDWQLYVFCAGGAVAGFTVGYYWRSLFGQESRAQANQVDEPLERKAP